uniref:NAHD dehydrogenase subunit 6 n=1 Tax=Scolopendra dehaani TaxID=2609776 RepID=A0A343JML4_SCODE|nr:NAHD dehydrogenase subunit 6 [Scolopendra dehaani]
MLLLISNTNPITLIMIIMLQTMWTALLTNMNKEMFWYGYILILIFLGGMLILFSYICSLASNEIFHKFNISILLLSLLTMTMNFKIPFNSTSNYNFMNTTTLYMQNFMMMMLLLAYLLITLLIITKITMYKSGPLQQISYDKINTKITPFNKNH